MLARLLVIGIIWVAFSASFVIGVKHASKDINDKIRFGYLRGYNDGYEARSIDAAKLGITSDRIVQCTLTDKETEVVSKWLNAESRSKTDRDIIHGVLRRLL